MEMTNGDGKRSRVEGTVRLEPGLYDRLRAAAHELRMSQNEIMTEALERFLRIDQVAWQAGYSAAAAGDNQCPYTAGTPEAWAWSSGWIEGHTGAAAPIAPAERAGE